MKSKMSRAGFVNEGSEYNERWVYRPSGGEDDYYALVVEGADSCAYILMDPAGRQLLPKVPVYPGEEAELFSALRHAYTQPLSQPDDSFTRVRKGVQKGIRAVEKALPTHQNIDAEGSGTELTGHVRIVSSSGDGYATNSNYYNGQTTRGRFLVEARYSKAAVAVHGLFRIRQTNLSEALSGEGDFAGVFPFQTLEQAQAVANFLFLRASISAQVAVGLVRVKDAAAFARSLAAPQVKVSK